MRKVKIEDGLDAAVDALKKGELVMHPTETCYGFAVDISNGEALKKLYEVKKMDLDKPVSILVSNLEMAMKYGQFSDKALELAENYWPGPLAILLPRSSELPNFLNPGSEFVSLRFSDNQFCIDMVEKFGVPVTTTSANASGEKQVYSVEESGDWLDEVDLVVDGGRIPENPPSTIVRVNGEELEILRQGSISL